MDIWTMAVEIFQIFRGEPLHPIFMHRIALANNLIGSNIFVNINLIIVQNNQ